MSKIQTVGQVLIDNKRFLVNASCVNKEIINISMLKNDNLCGFVNLSIPPKDKPIQILLLESTQEIKGIGTKLLQATVEIAGKLNKEIILDCVETNRIKGNPIAFYFTKGFRAMDENINFNLENMLKASQGHINTSAYNKLGIIPMRMSKEAIELWRKLVIGNFPIFLPKNK